MGIDLGREPVPDSTTITKFRKLLNDNKLGEALFAQVGRELLARGFKLNTGTIVDATIIGTPSSTKNTDNARDPDMHQTRKGQQRGFAKVRYRGLQKNATRSFTALALANIYLSRQRLMAQVRL